MRTTIVLPPSLLRAAKARSAAQGESLKSLITRAVSAEVAAGAAPPRSTRLVLPLVGNPSGPKVRVTNRDLADRLAAADAQAARPNGRRARHPNRRKMR
jgi:hypothetical protein